MVKKLKKAVKKAVKNVKKRIAVSARRKLELSYAKKMIKTLTEDARGSGFGAAMVKNKDGKVEMVQFTNKEQAIALLNRVKKGELSLVI